ncbi:hypothetical protein ACH41H_44695 [Streptomyces sp. NPDC020800]|uniref:hypothetical protein n=1 Tax=Streptomyces sp. NPDC020800 TaxID=3365092 RepID=UPI0037A8C37B
MTPNTGTSLLADLERAYPSPSAPTGEPTPRPLPAPALLEDPAVPASRPAPAPPYTVVAAADVHQVVDSRHGYALAEHPDRAAAAEQARHLAADPTAAVAAVRALDTEQNGPAADARRILRRYGYRWALVESAMRDLRPYETDLSERELAQLLADGHLVMVWDLQGLPFYTTPERYAELDLTWIEDEGERFPAVPLAELQRPTPRLDLARAARREVCDHGLTSHRCALCGPREAYECQWATCTANAVANGVCERCFDAHATTLTHRARRNSGSSPAA